MNKINLEKYTTYFPFTKKRREFEKIKTNQKTLLAILGEESFLTRARFSVRKQTFFAKRLSFLIQSGVSMLDSVHVIRKQAKSKSEIKVFDRLITDIANGQTLAVSLGRFRGVFSPFAINIIKAGERSGTLMQNLSYLADELKKKDMLRKKIMSAMFYPLIITVATFGITGVLVVYIFPKILPIFESLNAQLPLSTRVLIFLSDVLRNSGVYLLLGLFAFMITFSVVKKYVPKFKFFIDGLVLRIPIFGNIVLYYNLTNSTRTLGLLLRSGLSLTEALIITAETTENTRYRNAYESVSHGVLKGKNMSEILHQFPLVFPQMLTHMTAIGEKSGNLSTTLIYLSEFYENEFEDQTKNLSSAIEPVLMIVMGIMVGFVAVSVITPIYEITNTLQR